MQNAMTNAVNMTQNRGTNVLSGLHGLAPQDLSNYLRLEGVQSEAPAR